MLALGSPSGAPEGAHQTCNRPASPPSVPSGSDSADDGLGPHSSRSGAFHYFLQWDGAPWGWTPQRGPLRTGRSFYVLLARPFGGNPKKPQLHYHHVFPYWQTSMEKFRLIIPRNLQIAVFGKVKPHVILIR